MSDRVFVIVMAAAIVVVIAVPIGCALWGMQFTEVGTIVVDEVEYLPGENACTVIRSENGQVMVLNGCRNVPAKGTEIRVLRRKHTRIEVIEVIEPGGGKAER